MSRKNYQIIIGRKKMLDLNNLFFSISPLLSKILHRSNINCRNKVKQHATN